MGDVAIRVDGLGKRYIIGKTRERHDTLRDALVGGIRTAFHRARQSGRGAGDDTIWALKDVSFEVKRGEVVGIIGRNGAGKSTLLKILSRITKPTQGRAEIHGRVGSLLEVGTGFHPELTGRENIYLNGAILGMRKSEIARKFDEIVAFAEIERFLDTPVKRYSSGMYVRLAFAVAAHLETEILLVDEVLAVGDAVFQRKCLGKLGHIARDGRTVLFVSHNLVAIKSLCGTAVRLHGGQKVDEGRASDVVSLYLAAAQGSQPQQRWDDLTVAPGNDRVRLHYACASPRDGQGSERITTEDAVVLEFQYWNLVSDAYLNLGLQVFAEDGAIAFATGPVDETVWHGRPFPVGLFCSLCHIPGDLLNAGTYRVEMIVIENQTNPIYRYDEILVFEVGDVVDRRGGSWYGKWPGAVHPQLEWTTQLVDTPVTGPGELPG